jgi:uncharacterized membrane protein YcjF (UPF0283 family)
MFFVDEGFTFRNFLVDAFTIFVFVVTIWLLITVFMDLFRRHDISGWAKALWVIGLIIFPLLAVLVYLITQSRGMAERNVQQAQQARDELRRVVGFTRNAIAPPAIAADPPAIGAEIMKSHRQFARPRPVCLAGHIVLNAAL